MLRWQRERRMLEVHAKVCIVLSCTSLHPPTKSFPVLRLKYTPTYLNQGSLDFLFHEANTYVTVNRWYDYILE